MNAWTLADLRQWRVDHPAGRLILYGAGDLGKLALAALQRQGIRVDAFWDDSLSKQGARWRDVPVCAPAGPNDAAAESRILVSMNYLSTALATLQRLGLTDVSTCARLFESLDLSDADVGVHRLEIDRKIAWHLRECAKLAQKDRLELKYIDVVVTEACSMRCADCSNLMQYYAKPRHADFDDLCADLDHLFAAVDWIDEVRLLGGEPLINKRFGDIVRHVTARRNFRHLVIYTNGTVLPGPTTMAALADPRVTVNITDYGRLSRNRDAFIAALEGAGVAHLVKQPSWTDSGRIHPQTAPPEALNAQFERCCVNDILTLLHGQIYRCPFSANLANLGVAPVGPDEAVPVTGDPASLRDGLRALYARDTHLSACAFCKGRDFSTPKIPAAIQTPRPLPLPNFQPDAENR